MSSEQIFSKGWNAKGQEAVDKVDHGQTRHKYIPEPEYTFIGVNESTNSTFKILLKRLTGLTIGIYRFFH